MKTVITAESSFCGLRIMGGEVLHPKASRFLISKGFTVSYEGGTTIIENKEATVDLTSLQIEGRRIQEEIDAQIAKERFAAVIAPLTHYSVAYLPSIFASICSLFGHHHENRVQAIINALKTASIEENIKILSHQITLMTEENPNLNPLTNLNIVNSALLDYRWQTRLPGHRNVPNSGYLTALRATLANFEVVQSNLENTKPSAAPASTRAMA